MKYILLTLLIAGCGQRETDYKAKWIEATSTQQTFRNDSDALKSALARLRHTPPRSIIKMTADTIEITPIDMVFVRIAGELIQVERDGKWMRYVDDGTPSEDRRSMAYVELDSLKVNPYYYNRERQSQVIWIDSAGFAHSTLTPDDFQEPADTPINYFKYRDIKLTP